MSATAVPFVLRPRDGLTVKDARGFNLAGGLAARSLAWPLPPTLAGATRTAVGRARGYLDSPANAAWPTLLREVAVAGPLALVRAPGDTAFAPLWPLPADAVGVAAAGGGSRPVRLCPGPRSADDPTVQACFGQSLAAEAKAIDALWQPCLAPAAKPRRLPGWWSHADFLTWLRDPRSLPAVQGDFDELPRRTNIHLAIDPEQYTARTGALFSLETIETLLRKGGEIALYARARLAADEPLPTREPWPFGGEGRLARAELVETDPYGFPDTSWNAWKPSRRFRLILVTPGLFHTGWRPDWLRLEPDEAVFRGQVPERNLKVSLRAALVGRGQPASGWDLARREPKPSRRLVPAGSAFFFEAERELTATDLSDLWLHCIETPDTQPARDGFGLVVPGAWPEP